MRRNRRGSNVIEFALLMPLYTAFMMGIIDYSYMIYQKSSITSAAQEGCRSASMMDPGLAEVNVGAVYAAANSRMKTQLIAKGVPCATGCTQATIAVSTYPTRALRCDLRVPFQSLTGLSPAPSHVKARAVVRLEYQRK